MSTAKKLKKYKLKKGDKLAIIGQNCAEYPILILALFEIGVIAVPISYRFPADQIKRLLDKIQCNSICILNKQQQFNKQYQLEDFDKIVKNYIKEEDILSLEDIFDTNNNQKITQDSLVFKIATLGRDLSLNKDITNNENLATIVFTSGSSGEPKAALHSLENHFYNAIGSNQNIPFQPQDRWLLSLPLYHVGGLAIIIRTLLGRGAIVIPDNELDLLDNINYFNPTHISLFATQLYRLLQDAKAIESLSKLKAILLGGSTIPDELIKRAFFYNLPIYTTYGSTEMASQITTTSEADIREKI